MSIEWFIYFADILPNIGGFLGFICGVGMLVLAVVSGFMATYASDNDEPIFSFLRQNKVFKILAALIFCGFLSLIFPSQKTMYLMLGSHYLKNSNMPAKIEQVLNKKLDEYLDEEKK